MITIKTRITFKEFFLYYLKSNVMLFISMPILAMIFFILKDFNEGSEKEIYQSSSFWLIIICVFISSRSYLRLRRSFYSNKKIQENISYTFTNEKMYVKGETFEAEVIWNTVYKVKENKNWFLIFQSAQIMNMIPKKYFTENQISELRNIIKDNNVKSKLLND